jgi:hypothetical protein
MIFIEGIRTGKTALLNEIKELKRDFSRMNNIIYKEHEFLKEHGVKPNELIVNYNFYSEMLIDPEIAYGVINNKEDLTTSFRGMKVIIDNSIERFEVRYNDTI